MTQQDNQSPEIFGQTPWQTVGPFFHYCLPWKGAADLAGQSDQGSRQDLLVAGHDHLLARENQTVPAGELISLSGVVTDGVGEPVPDAMLEIWHADSQGRYDPTFATFGRCATDDDGRYRFTTVRPGAFAAHDETTHAPQIHIGVFARGVLKRLVTRIYFDDAPENDSDPTLLLVPDERRSTLIAEPIDDEWRFRYRAEWCRRDGVFPMLSGLFGPFSGDNTMLALFQDDALVGSAVRYEQALAGACAHAGLIDQQDADVITGVLEGMQIDAAAIVDDAKHAGTLAIPLVQRLRAAVAEVAPDAADLVHFGSTSQDVIDTVLAMQCIKASERVALEGSRLCAALAELAKQHAHTPMLGRTLLRGALPITFGLKVSNWLNGIDDALLRIRADAAKLSVQFGGPVGTLSGMDGKGAEIAGHVAQTLGLRAPELPWADPAERYRRTGLQYCGREWRHPESRTDVALLGQDEIAEVFEASEPGGAVRLR